MRLIAPFGFGPTNTAPRPKPPGIRGYPPVSRPKPRPSTVAGDHTKCPQTRAILLGSARRVGLVAPPLKIVVSAVRVRLSPFSSYAGAQAEETAGSFLELLSGWEGLAGQDFAPDRSSMALPRSIQGSPGSRPPPAFGVTRHPPKNELASHERHRPNNQWSSRAADQ